MQLPLSLSLLFSFLFFFLLCAGVSCFDQLQIWEAFSDLPSHDKAFDVHLRQWPWESWIRGPPCPLRYHQKYLPINESLLTEALKEVNLLIDAELSGLEGIGISSGISVSIVYDQQILLAEGYGVANLKTGEKPTADTIFDVGSVTKVFTSLSLLQTIQNGLASIDDPVDKYFNEQQPPVFSINNPYSTVGSKVVTLHGLATHSSGLPREPPCGVYPLTQQCENLTYAADYNLQTLSQFGLLFPPFTASHYSNFGVSLLGRCLERAWNQKYEDYMVEKIFVPLGMTSSGFSFTQDVIDRMAVGYIAKGPTANGTYFTIPSPYNTVEMAWSAPAGGLYSTANDFATFFSYLFARNDTDAFKQITIDTYNNPGVYLPDGISAYGLGTWETAYANGYWTLTKGGLVSGFASSISMVPQLKLGVSVLINVNSGYAVDQINAKINSVLVPAIENALSKAQQQLPLPPNYQQWIGSYGFNKNSPLVTINAPTDESGILTGYVTGPGAVQFIWDQNQNYNGLTSFRYSTTSHLDSCFTKTGLGNGAIAYFGTDSKIGLYVTVADENSSLFYIPKIS